MTETTLVKACHVFSRIMWGNNSDTAEDTKIVTLKIRAINCKPTNLSPKSCYLLGVVIRISLISKQYFIIHYLKFIYII